MSEQLNKIEAKIDKILDRVGDHGERLTSVETHQKGFIAILSAFGLGIVSWIFNKFSN